MSFPNEEQIKNLLERISQLEELVYHAHPIEDKMFHGYVDSIVVEHVDGDDVAFLKVIPCPPTVKSNGDLVPGSSISGGRYDKIFVLDLDSTKAALGACYAAGDIVPYWHYSGILDDAEKVRGSYVTRSTVKIYPARVTSVGSVSMQPTWFYTVQKVVKFDDSQIGYLKYVTDGHDLDNVLNRDEFAPQGGTYPYVYGNGLSVTDMSGHINKGLNALKPVGIGDVVLVSELINTDGTVRRSFTQCNSIDPGILAYRNDGDCDDEDGGVVSTPTQLYNGILFDASTYTAPTSHVGTVQSILANNATYNALDLQQNVWTLTVGPSGYSSGDNKNFVRQIDFDSASMAGSGTAYPVVFGISGVSGTDCKGWEMRVRGTVTIPNGISGFSGYSGYSGMSGFSGISGYSGVNGASGTSGYSGYSGSGISGFSGSSGFSGATPTLWYLTVDGSTPIFTINTGTHLSSSVVGNTATINHNPPVAAVTHIQVLDWSNSPITIDVDAEGHITGTSAKGS